MTLANARSRGLSMGGLRVRLSQMAWARRFPKGTTPSIPSGPIDQMARAKIDWVTTVKSSKSINSLHRGCVMSQTIKPYPAHRIARRPISSLQSFKKRTFDIVVAIAGLLMFSPLILLISLWVRIESPGPVLCRYKRYSANNAEFEVFEFRTTLVNRKGPLEEPDKTQRITRFGHILRSSSMSKLPRLINVLCGELSIVGIHLFATAPGKAFPSIDLHQIKPGLVTWAHANEDQREIVDTITNIDCWINSDRFYIENSSLLFDMKILLRTLLSKTTHL